MQVKPAVPVPSQHMARLPEPPLKIKPVTGEAKRLTHPGGGIAGGMAPVMQRVRQGEDHEIGRRHTGVPRRLPKGKDQRNRQVKGDGHGLCHARSLAQQG